MSAPLVGVTPIFATCFWGNDMGKLIAVRLPLPHSIDGYGHKLIHVFLL